MVFGMIVMFIGIFFIIIGWTSKQLRYAGVGLLLSLGGMLFGIGNSPSRDAPNGSPGMVSTGVIFLIIGVILFIVVFVIDNRKLGNIKRIKVNVENNGMIYIDDNAKINRRNKEEHDYNDAYEEAHKTAKERYTIDFETISKFLDLGIGLAANNVQEGIRLQQTDAPQRDWAIAGGLAAGLGGTGVGIAAALDTMEENRKATERQHERGRSMVEQGLEGMQSLQRSKDDILSAKYDNFEVSAPDPELMGKIKVTCYDTENYNTGYFTAKMKFCAPRNIPFAGNNKKFSAIDGSVRVDFYDKAGTELLASGYYSAPGRYGNDLSATGFSAKRDGKLAEDATVTLKIIDGKIFNKNKGYTIKLAEPNLWLLKL